MEAEAGLDRMTGNTHCGFIRVSPSDATPSLCLTAPTEMELQNLAEKLTQQQPMRSSEVGMLILCFAN